MNKSDVRGIRAAATAATREHGHESCGECLLLVADRLDALIDQVHQEMKATEKAEQERDQALEKARDRESARVIQTDRADGISETLQEARKHIDELEEKYTDTRLAVARLKAAQRQRPMDEAPKDGSRFHTVRRTYWDEYHNQWQHGPIPYWLPLPDQDEKATS